jgi:diguanylate cyclase (GGDEF)-like protein
LVDAAKVLELIRPYVLVIDRFGTVRGAHGGLGNAFGYEAGSMVGRSVFEFVPTHLHQEVATFFVSQPSEKAGTTLTPLPFRTHVLDARGNEVPVDVVPTGRPDDPEVDGWVVVLVPLSMQSAPSRSLDAELTGASHDHVKSLLAAELDVDMPEWKSRWILIDAPGTTHMKAYGAPTSEPDLVESVRRLVELGWQPWFDIGGERDARIVSELPDWVQAGFPKGWNFTSGMPIFLGDELVAALVRIAMSADNLPEVLTRTNVTSRLRSLAQVTQLLYGRWRDADRLLTAATTDQLTGLANRATFEAAMADGARISVLYVDVDCFKDINDAHGHTVGDLVLVEVARRLKSVCRPTDVVARFGGDEFVVLLRDIDPLVAEQIGHRVVSLAAEPLQIDGGPTSITVSVGLSTEAGSQNPVDAADQAMLVAKRTGRDRLALAET